MPRRAFGLSNSPRSSLAVWGGRNVLSCPLLVSVDKGKYTSVVFIENGQRLGASALKPAEGKGP
jgi:hypothetical protein